MLFAVITINVTLKIFTKLEINMNMTVLWLTLDTWLAQPLRKTTTASSPLHQDHQQTVGNPLNDE